MEQRLERMQQLSSDLNKLFSLCGVQVPVVEPAPASSVYRLLEYIWEDKALLTYLEALHSQAVLATQQAERANRDQRLLRITLEQEEKQSKDLREKLQHQTDAGNHRKTLVKQLIENADRLTLCLDHLCRDEDQLASQLVQQQLNQIRQMLQSVGVETVEEAGLFDCHTQMAVDTEYTEEEILVGCIAKTVRPGYRDNGTQLRPQEVIVYSAYMG